MTTEVAEVEITRVSTEYKANIPIRAEIQLHYEKVSATSTTTKLKKAYILLFCEGDDTPYGIETPITIYRDGSYDEKMQMPTGLIACFQKMMDKLVEGEK